MNIEVITKDDLQQLKVELIAEIRQLVSKGDPKTDSKWLRSAQVRQLLSISPGTLQNLRVQGLIRYTKIGGSFFYQRDEIERMLSSPQKSELFNARP